MKKERKKGKKLISELLNSVLSKVKIFLCFLNLVEALNNCQKNLTYTESKSICGKKQARSVCPSTILVY